MSAISPDYESDPARRRSWRAPLDVHEVVAPRLRGPVVDIGSGEGRLAELLDDEVFWVGVDDSPSQLAECERRPLVRADMRALPFRDGTFHEAAHLWCLYHLDEPVVAIREAVRVLRQGGRYLACTSARDNDPELVPRGYPPSTFDAEEAPEIVATVLPEVAVEAWDDRFFALETRDEVRAYCRHNEIPARRADEVDVPLWLTKRGCLVTARRPER